MNQAAEITVKAEEISERVSGIIGNRGKMTMFGEAEEIRSLLEQTHMTQETCASRLGVSQSYVANKLRLLRLSEAEREKILTSGLSERHARALLRLEGGSEREEALSGIIERGLNVSESEEFIEKLLCAKFRREEKEAESEKSERRKSLIVREIKQFCSSVDCAVDVIKKSGVAVRSTREEAEEGVKIFIFLPKKAG